MEQLSGYIENIIYHNESNHFTVMDLDCNGNLCTVTGNFPALNKGEYITVEGAWVEHPTFGTQMKAHRFTLEIPETDSGVEKYLSSGLIEGIGPKKARVMMDHFGKEVIDIIRYNPDKLTEIPGIGQKTAQRIAESFREQREVMDIVMYLGEFGISTYVAMKVYKVYGEHTISVIKENPYRMVRDVYGIGFKIADEIAIRSGIEPFSPFRVMAGIEFILQECYRNGNTYMEEKELIEKSTRILGVDEQTTTEYLQELTLQAEVRLQNLDGKRVYYPMALFVAEENVAHKLNELRSYDYKDEIINHDSIIADFEKKESIQLDQDQKDAVVSALSSGTVIITGGPGTGKTTIIKCILEIFLSLEYKVALAAPTGRAAKRMTEATGEEAKTLHRLLEYGYGEDDYEQTFERNEENPLEQDLIVIDEASMIDTLLMNHFLKAIAPGTRIILVGDVNQLPSVGPGNVLKDIIDSGVVKVVLLRKIFRQAQESQIVMNAHRINSGDLPIANEEGTDFFMLHAATQEKIRTKIIETCATRLTNYKDYDPFTDIQVITPVKKGPVGVKELNTALQGELNPPSQEKTERKFLNGLFREGDKVMQIKNNYGMKWSDEREGDGEGIFNGDIGRIQSIDESGKKVIVRFDDGKTVVYSFEQMDELVLSYAITVHKSQGSEFNAVVMPIFKGPGMLLNRNLLYTAVTRGKEMVVLIGHKPYLKFMIDNVNVNRRKTGLKERIAHDLWAD